MTLPVTRGTPFGALRVAADCKRCGGRLEYLAPGIVTGEHSRALVQCASCRREFQVFIAITPVEVIR